MLILHTTKHQAQNRALMMMMTDDGEVHQSRLQAQILQVDARVEAGISKILHE